ncbi:MAG: hypothetical protein JRF23_05255, partial [Deltaproteobacteria bacterium]|nr:hypothetical protein [Deltaproteobacteria bacterium]
MNRILDSNTIDDLVGALAQSATVAAVGLSAAALACAVARVHRRTGRPVAVVVADGDGAEAMQGDLAFFLGQDAHLLSFPAYNLRPFKRLAYHGDTAATR